jgi:hypothetical protein
MWTKRLEAGSYKVEKRDGYEDLTDPLCSSESSVVLT